MVAVALVVAALELGLRAVAALSPRVAFLLSVHAVAIESDAALGTRLVRGFPEHDELGFRNAPREGPPEVVVLGDSQTYGTNVERTAAWPQQVGGTEGGRVYNMGTPGHCAVQGLLQVEAALSLSPRVVISTVYAGNDAYDAYVQLRDRRCPVELAGHLDAASAARDRQQGIEDRIGAEFTAAFGAATPAPPPAGLRGLFARHSALYGVLRALRRGLRPPRSPPAWPAVRAAAAARPGQLVVDGAVPTILTPAYRRCALAYDDPRLVAGIRILQAALGRTAEAVRASGAELWVLSIPTKERVYATAAGAAGVRSPALEALVRDEERLVAELRAFCAQRGLRWLDSFAALAAVLERGEAPYPHTADGHPNPRGHAAIAGVVRAALEAW